ncbi:MAG: amino acid adenylation protein [Polyangiaceae bacterium]|nr:amino acid adenylation protein [Polyangiaceae bacterium]
MAALSDTDGSSTFDPFAGPAIVAAAPTTEPQREIWTACALGDDASLAFNESVTLTFEGSLNVDALRSAFDDVVARHDSLRSTLSADGLSLLVGSATPGALELVDHSGLEPAAQQAERLGFARHEVRTPFDLLNGPLFRARLVKLNDRQHYVILTAHHIVFDGWSNAVLVADWAALYAHRLGVAKAPASAPSFAEYARYQAALPPEVGLADEAYWLQRFSDTPSSVDLPSDRLRPPLKSFSSNRQDLHLDSELTAALRRTGATFKASLFATLFGAFNVLVNRLSQQEDLVIGIPAAGQSQGDYAGLVGHCVNMLPIRSTVLRTEPFSELLGRVRSSLLDAQEHQSFTFGKLLTKLPLPRDPSRLPLVSVIFNVDRASNDSARFPDLSLRVFSNPRAFENFDLFLNAVEADGKVELECQYNTDLFDASTITRWLATYETLLRSITREPTAWVGHLNAVSDADHQQIAAWNERSAEFPRERCGHDLVTAVALSSPDRVACEFQGQSLTYAELNERAEAFARKLRSMGVRQGRLVGLCVERSPALIVGALAIWKAGGAYVPMDPGYPRERLAQMLEDSQATVLVTEAAVNKELALQGAALAFIDEPPDSFPDVSLDQDAATPVTPAYVIYTSGSTGKPKGVLVPHSSVVNLLSSVAKEPGLSSEDIVLAVTTLSFDIAVSEIWLPLTVGAKIVMVSRETASDGGLLREVVESRRVTFIDATPATYRLLLGAGWTGAPSIKAICTGEAMPLDLARQLLSCCGSLWNGYGPTETTVWSTFWQVPPSPTRVLIGHPVDNTRIYVLDEQRRQVPINVPGELYIAGSGVTLGYLNRPELTSERFVEDPFEPGARMYRTGDVGRWLPSGELECMGRNDNQVKLRGFRIELGEIESALGQHEALGQVAVIKREDRPGDAKLVAYFVAKGDAPSAAKLREHLKTTLPDYMVPASFVKLDRMPLTPSGKIDRRALPAPEAGPVGSDAEFVAPRTPMEKVMAELWSAMLGVGRVGVNDDFFALGGHSLLASQILARLRRDHGVQLSFRKFFEAPTVARLAKEAEAAAGVAPPTQVPLLRREPGSPVPLSMAQERITLMEQMHPSQQTTHILPAAWQMTGPVDLKLLQTALDVVAQRHETLRTVISASGSPMRQLVRPELKLTIELRDLRDLPEAERHPAMMKEIRERTTVPFNLYEGPLFRSVLYQLEDQSFVYFTLRHNVIWDGWSYDVFLADLTESYAALAEGRASKLPEPPIAYGDFVIWQRETLKGAEIARQRDWWHQELADSPADLPLPYDFPRPLRMNYEGGTVILRFSQAQINALTALGHQANTTLFMVLFSAYATLLQRYTGQSDLLIGLPVRGRPLPELENLIGSFTNTIVLRARFAPDESFRDFLKKTRDRALDAFSNEQLPLEMLQIRPPVVRALFSFQDARTRPVGMGGVSLKQVDVEPPAQS